MKSFYALGLLILSISSFAQAPTINSTYGVTGECKAVVYGNGTYVASTTVAGNLPGVFTSADAKTWTPLPSGQSPTGGFSLLAFGNGVFVGAAFPGIMYSSTDGAGWTQRSTMPGIIGDLKFIQGAFYALGSGATIYKSTDGINWAPFSLGITIPTDYNLVNIDYGGGQFAIGAEIPEDRFTPEAVEVYHSATGDPGSWTESFVGTNLGLTKLMWLKDRFYLFTGNGSFLTSTDANTWAPPSPPPVDTLTDGTVGTVPDNYRPAGFTSGDSVYLMGPNYGNGTYAMQVSVDGTHFKSLYSSGMIADGGLSVNGLRIIYGNGGISTSTDGIHFYFNSTNFAGLASNGSGFVAVGFGHMFSSPDFVSWTDRTPPTVNGLPDITSLVYTGTKYLAAGAKGNIYTSNDGAAWSITQVPYSFQGMGYGAGRFVAAAYNDTIQGLATSTDGISWSLVDTNLISYYHIRYINNSFFALGVSFRDLTGRIMQSADGIHWQNITPTVSFGVTHYSDVMYDGTKYYFTGIKKDSSGNWGDFFTLSTTNPANTGSYGAAGSIVNPAPGTSVGDYIAQFGDFVYHNGQFVGSAEDRVDQQAYLVYSSDGMNWTTTPLNGPLQARTIVVDGDIYRIVGDGGGRYSVTFPGPPAKLLDFRAMAVGSRFGENSRLTWRTAGETNIDYFLVQHSLDTLHWDSIGMVNAIERRHGTANYQFTHMDPPAGANYYRLGLIDTNGRRQWSSIRRVDIRNRRNVCIYPNPARGVLHVQLPEPGQATLVVYNSAGRLVRQQVVSGYNATLNLGSLPAGFYHLLIFQGGNRYQKEFIIAEQFSPGY